MSDLYLAKTLS